MIDNLLFEDIYGVILDIYIVNSGSSEHVLYDSFMQSLEAPAGGSTGTYFPITLTVPMSIKYLNKTLYYQ
jgi:hypothetical protein